MTSALNTTNDGVHTDHHIFTLRGAIVKRHTERFMPAPNHNTLGVGWNQRTCNANVFAFT
jgi:hypothetical protein